MQHIGRVDVFQATQYLVYEVLDMIDSKRLPGVDYTMQICLHEILHDIHVFEFLGAWRWRDNVHDANDLDGKYNREYQ
jgi:hypothetical protein